MLCTTVRKFENLMSLKESEKEKQTEKMKIWKIMHEKINKVVKSFRS